MDMSPSLNTSGRLKQPLLVRRQGSAIDCVIGACGRLEPSQSEDAEYSVTNGVWEAPDDGKRTATDLGFGIKFLQHHGGGQHPDKLLEYETEQLESRPFSIILEETRRASVLAMPHVLRSMATCAVTSVAAIAVSLVLEDEVMSVIAAVNGVVSAGLFFLLGPYVGLCITRWWQMRTEFLGGVWGAVSDLNLYASIWFHSGSEEDAAARSLVQRYGLLAHLLLYKDARGQTSLEDAIGKGLLLPHEANVLQPLPSRTQMVFTWLAAFFNRALSEAGAREL